MNKRTKLILSVIGVGALVLPVVLLVLLTERGGQVPEIPGDSRQIDARNVEEAAKRTIPVIATPTPQPATPSASPATTGSENSPSP